MLELVEDNEKQLMHRVNSITITIILISWILGTRDENIHYSIIEKR